MTGFPRSGTTLLENALDAHPAIETFEELPSRAAMQVYLDRALPLIRDRADAERVYLKAREKYYGEAGRRRHKPAARVLINYGFLFQSPDAKPLYRWAEFFGYPTR